MRFAWTVLMMLVTALSTWAASENTHWSLQPIVRPAPKIPDAESEIDSFILGRLAHVGLKMSPQADRRMFVRRLFYDVIGLPPTPAQVDQFVNDR